MTDSVKNLSDEEMTKLRGTRNADEWNKLCDEIKAARGGACPPDWYKRVVHSGFAALTQCYWT